MELSNGNKIELDSLISKLKIDDKEALSIIDFNTVNTKDRFTGDVIVKNNEIGELVGFINKCSIINQNENDRYFSELTMLFHETLTSIQENFNENGEEIENIITDTVAKMESLREGHEVSAFVGLKLQEMIEQQVKLGSEMNHNSQILINLKKNIKNNIEMMKKNIELLKAKLNKK